MNLRFEIKHAFVKVLTHSYIILQLKCKFPVDISSCFTHLSQKFLKNLGSFWVDIQAAAKTFFRGWREERRKRKKRHKDAFWKLICYTGKKITDFWILIWISQRQILKSGKIPLIFWMFSKLIFHLSNKISLGIKY